MKLIALPKPLRDVLGEEASHSLIELFNEQAESQKSHLMDIVEDRFAKRVLESENRQNVLSSGVKTELTKKIHEVKTELSEKINEVKSELTEKINEVKTELTDKIAETRLELSTEIHNVEKNIREDMNKGFLNMQKQFTDIQRQFAELHKQMTLQTRWLISLFGFLAIALKLIDVFFGK